VVKPGQLRFQPRQPGSMAGRDQPQSRDLMPCASGVPRATIEDVVVSITPDLAADADRSRVAGKARAAGTMPAAQRAAWSWRT